MQNGANTISVSAPFLSLLLSFSTSLLLSTSLPLYGTILAGAGVFGASFQLITELNTMLNSP